MDELDDSWIHRPYPTAPRGMPRPPGGPGSGMTAVPRGSAPRVVSCGSGLEVGDIVDEIRRGSRTPTPAPPPGRLQAELEPLLVRAEERLRREESPRDTGVHRPWRSLKRLFRRMISPPTRPSC